MLQNAYPVRNVVVQMLMRGGVVVVSPQTRPGISDTQGLLPPCGVWEVLNHVRGQALVIEIVANNMQRVGDALPKKS